MPASQSAPYDSAAPADAERLQWALRSVDALPRRRDQLLPALLVASVLRARERRGEGTAPRRLALAAASGALGALGYVALLAQFEGASSDLLRAAPALVFAAISTALLATMCAAALWRFRTSSGGLFA